MPSYTKTWNESAPAGGDPARQGDNEIRDLKYAWRERFAEDHLAYDDETGHSDVGYHRRLTLVAQSTPAAVAGALRVYSKSVAAFPELHSLDPSANEYQLTLDGKLWIPALKVASEARGDMIVRGASLWGRTAIGTSGYYWKSNGTDPAWAALSVLFSELPAGAVIQDYYKEFTARVAGGTTVMPLDNSIGTTSEGHEFMVADAFTPLSASSKIYVEFGFLGELSANETICGGIFYDSVANAIKMGASGATSRDVLVIKTRIDSWGLSARTFKFRAGATGGGAGLDMNGYTTQLFGGVACSWVRIWEIKA